MILCDDDDDDDCQWLAAGGSARATPIKSLSGVAELARG